MAKITKIQIKRGLEANLPTLSAGEPAFTTDQKNFYIGDGILNQRYLKSTGDTMTGNLNMGTYTLIGGTGITDILKLQSTTGNGTLTSPAIQLLTGNNGATTAVTVLNNGNVGIGTTAPAGRLHINGTADDEQLIIEAHSSQTANLTEWRNSSGTALASISGAGDWGIGTSPDSSYKSYIYAGNKTNVLQVYGYSNVNYSNGLGVSFTAQGTSYHSALSGIAYSGAGAGQTTPAISGLSFKANHGDASTVTSLSGVEVSAQKSGANVGATSLVVGANSSLIFQSTGTASTTSNAYLFRGSVTKTGGSVDSISNLYGIYLPDMTIATNNYALYTNAGLNRLGDQLLIDGSADRIQLRVQAHSTQTTNLQTWENSSGAVLGGVAGDGRFGVGTTPIASNKLYVYSAVNDSASYSGITSDISVATTTNTSNAYNGLNFSVNKTGAYNVGFLRGVIGSVYHSGSGGTTSSMQAIYTNVGLLGASSAGVISNAYHIVISQINRAVGSTTTVGNAYGINISNQGDTYVTSAHGIYIHGQTGATNNYAILTNAGNIVFNEGGDASTDFRVESDTEANMLYLDANGDTDGALYLGGTTNGIKINKGGVLTFLGTANISGGATGTFTTADAKTVTVTKGIITSIV